MSVDRHSGTVLSLPMHPVTYFTADQAPKDGPGGAGVNWQKGKVGLKKAHEKQRMGHGCFAEAKMFACDRFTISESIQGLMCKSWRGIIWRCECIEDLNLCVHNMLGARIHIKKLRSSSKRKSAVEATVRVYFPITWRYAARARSWRRWRRGNYCPAAGLFWAFLTFSNTGSVATSGTREAS
jgi:hypothetical protein